MAHDGCNCYFSFWGIFAFLPRNSPKNQNEKKNEKKKQQLEISSLYTCVPKMVPEIWCMTDGWTDGHTGRQKKLLF